MSGLLTSKAIFTDYSKKQEVAIVSKPGFSVIRRIRKIISSLVKTKANYYNTTFLISFKNISEVEWNYCVLRKGSPGINL